MSAPLRILRNAIPIVSDTITSRGRGLKNFFAKGGVGRVVVLESDDWGSQRVPSADAREKLKQLGILSDKSAYDRETLENAQDLEVLCGSLLRFKGSDGRAAIMTCFVNPANPDFAKIKEANFVSYFYEPTRAEHERRGDFQSVSKAWAAGLENSLLSREYHGREHLQVRSWLKALQANDERCRRAFNHSYYSVELPDVKKVAKGFRAAYLFSDFEEIQELEEVLVSGAKLFEEETGAGARVFCPPNNVFHPQLYPAVRAAGCDYILRHTHNLEPDGTGDAKDVWGQKGVREAGLIGYGRNALFEPEQGFGVDHTMRQVRCAFAWGVPAIISTHRVNYVGGIDPGVRERGAVALQELLRRITTNWPDVRFMSSSQLMQELAGLD